MENSIQNLILQNIQLKEKGLLPLQFAVLEKIKNRKYAFVFDEVGCGKTIESGIVIWDIVGNGGNKILVVCPSNLVFNWYNELLLKFGLDFKIIRGTKDSIDIYSHEIKHLNEISNLCIVTYDSREQGDSNAALDRIKHHGIVWDLIVLDEGHGSKNEVSLRYKTLEQYTAKKVLFLSATPIKTSGDNFNQECNLVGKILKEPIKFDDSNIEPKLSVSFCRDYPISRNFKEIMVDQQRFRNRKVNKIDYTIEHPTAQRIYSAYYGRELERKLGCIFNYSRAFSGMDEYKRFLKYSYDKDDLNCLVMFDNKLKKLFQEIDNILKSNHKVVIFANHRQVIDYLRKALVCKYGEQQIEAMHGDTYLPDERRNRIALLENKNSELSAKPILVISHQIGVVGINLSRFNHLINYELPDTPADLEQRFGRIDRITNLNHFDELTMYYFKDSNNGFDSLYIYRLFHRFHQEVLPLLPSKNLLYSSVEYVKWLNDLVSIYQLIAGKKQISVEMAGMLRVLTDNNDIPDEAMAERILNNIYNLIGYSNDDDLEAKIERYAIKVTNEDEVVYGRNRESLSYEALKKLVFTPEYEKFAADIKRYDVEIMGLHQEIRTKKSVDEIISFIYKRIRQDHVREELIFAIVYNVWKVWYMSEENKRCNLRCFFDLFNKGALQ